MSPAAARSRAGKARFGPAGCARDTGSASLWVLAGGLLVLVLALAVGLRATAVVARHRAEAAADLAALAAAQGIGVDDTTATMCRRAARIAAANGARLQTCTVRLDPSARSGTVQVTTAVLVRIAGVGSRQSVARAEAQRDPG